MELELIVEQNQKINAALLSKLTEIERDLEIIKRQMSELRDIANDTNNDLCNVDNTVRKIESRVK